ncbi:hypothetical protein BH10PSE19_BH10PSE19_17100 [soil metagenome]
MKNILWVFLLVVIVSCKKDTVTPSATNFILQSSDFANNGALPKDYTCDGLSASPPLNWINPPTGTVSFAVVMYHVPPSPEANHVYMLVYNIPSTVASLATNTTGVGLFGINTVNGKTEYKPPCSQGLGSKTYIMTVYALSAAPVFSVAQTQVTRDLLLAAISNTTFGTSTLTVTYMR